MRRFSSERFWQPFFRLPNQIQGFCVPLPSACGRMEPHIRPPHPAHIASYGFSQSSSLQTHTRPPPDRPPKPKKTIRKTSNDPSVQSKTNQRKNYAGLATAEKFSIHQTSACLRPLPKLLSATLPSTQTPVPKQLPTRTPSALTSLPRPPIPRPPCPPRHFCYLGPTHRTIPTHPF